MNGEGYTQANIPYQIAHEIEGYLVQRASEADHHVGRLEREVFAVQYTERLLEDNAVEPARLAYDGLHYWRVMFGRGVQGRG